MGKVPPLSQGYVEWLASLSAKESRSSSGGSASTSQQALVVGRSKVINYNRPAVLPDRRKLVALKFRHMHIVAETYAPFARGAN